MTYFPWDEINALESRAEEAIERYRNGDSVEKDAFIDEVTDLFEMDFMYGVLDLNDQLGRSIEPNYEDVREVIDRKIDGKDYKERISEYLENGTAYDISRVISTDAHRIYNEAMFETARENGATQKTWHTMLDDRVRDSHDYLEGVTVGIDDEFYTWNANHALYPGQFGVAEEDCGCRCWVTFS